MMNYLIKRFLGSRSEIEFIYNPFYIAEIKYLFGADMGGEYNQFCFEIYKHVSGEIH